MKVTCTTRLKKSYICVCTYYMYLLYMVLQDSNLALHSEGIKMTVAAEQPHFLAVDDDALGTGVVIYRLQVHIHVQGFI